MFVRQFAVVIIIVLVILASPQFGAAQLAELPDAPTPQVLAGESSSEVAAEGFLPGNSSGGFVVTNKPRAEPKKWEKISHRGLQIAFPIALAADMVTTNETHPYKFSYTATICENGTTYYPCHVGPIYYDLTWERKDYHLFEETGWARFLGPRNTPATITANVGLDVFIFFVDKKLWHKNTKLSRRTGLVMVGYKTAGHFAEAINNVRYVHRMEKWAIPADEGATDIRWY